MPEQISDLDHLGWLTEKQRAALTLADLLGEAGDRERVFRLLLDLAGESVPDHDAKGCSLAGNDWHLSCTVAK